MKFEVGKEYIRDDGDEYSYTFVVTSIEGTKLRYIWNRAFTNDFNKDFTDNLDICLNDLEDGTIRKLTKLEKALS